MSAEELRKLDSNYDGSCLCSAFRINDTKIEIHCWRVCSQCTYAGVHYLGDESIGELVMDKMINEGWTTSWSLQEGLRAGH